MVKQFCALNGEKNNFWKLLGARLNGSKELIKELGYDADSVSAALLRLVEEKKRTEPVDANDLSQRLADAMLAAPSGGASTDCQAAGPSSQGLGGGDQADTTAGPSRHASNDQSQRLPSGDSINRTAEQNGGDVDQESAGSDEIEEVADEDGETHETTNAESRDSACVSPKLLLPQEMVVI